MQYLITMGITVLTMFASVFGVYNFVPFDYLAVTGNTENFGAITEVASSDTMANFPTTYNANLAQLMRMSTSSVDSITTLSNLVSIGTITTGTWNSDIITVTYGGTGSSTLLANGVLYGNGTSGVLAVEVGSNEQILTLSGGVPVWASGGVDETLDYNFTGSVFNVKNLNASSTLILNGISLSFPSTQAVGSSTALLNDGSGNLTWNEPQSFVSTTSTLTISVGTGTTTVFTHQIPAGALSGQAVVFGMTGVGFEGNGATSYELNLSYGGVPVAYAKWVKDNTLHPNCPLGGSEDVCGFLLSFYMINDADGNQRGRLSTGSGTLLEARGYSASVDTGSAQTFLLEAKSNQSSNVIKFDSVFIQILQ